MPGCGDGVISTDEACDDGDTAAGDGCSPTCAIEPGFTCTGAPSACKTTCGDGVAAGTETCDDGANLAGDGCSPQCAFEATCGNHQIEPGESCDDGGTTSGDGCSATCQIEPGSTCGDAVNLGDPAQVTVSGAVTIHQGTTAGAPDTTFGDPPSCSAGTTGVPRVVHRYRTGGEPAVLQIETAEAGGALLDTVLWAYRDCQSPTAEVACGEDGPSGLLASAHGGYFPAGTTVFIVVSGYSTLDVGPYELRVTETPATLVATSGTCAAPTPIGSGTFAGVTLAGGPRSGNPAGACAGDAPDAVHVVNLQQPSDLLLSVEGSDPNRDLVLSLSSVPCGTGAEITCADARGAGAGESFSARDLPAGTYYVIVGGFGAADVGPYSLRADVVEILAAGATCDPASEAARCATGTLCHGGLCVAPKTLLSTGFGAGLAPLVVTDSGSDGQTWFACDPSSDCGSDNTTGPDPLDPYALVQDTPGAALDGELLSTPVLDAAGLTKVYVAMDQAFEHASASADLGAVEVSTDNIQWTAVASVTTDVAGPTTIDISALAAGHGAFWVRFRYDDQTSVSADPLAAGWRLDNVHVYGF